MSKTLEIPRAVITNCSLSEFSGHFKKFLLGSCSYKLKLRLQTALQRKEKMTKKEILIPSTEFSFDMEDVKCRRNTQSSITYLISLTLSCSC